MARSTVRRLLDENGHVREARGAWCPVCRVRLTVWPCIACRDRAELAAGHHSAAFAEVVESELRFQLHTTEERLRKEVGPVMGDGS